MNKIFKVIWNRTTQSLVVTSELAKGQVKSSTDASESVVVGSISKLFKLSAIALATLGLAEQANAVTAGNSEIVSGGTDAADNVQLAIGGGTTSRGGDIAIGPKSNANGQTGGAVAIGKITIATGNNALALATAAHAIGTKSTAIGSDSRALANNATALGNSANASADNATAIGSFTTATGTKAISMGTNAIVRGGESVALGSDSKVLGTNSVAIGSNTNITDIINGSAFGNYASVSAASGTALGAHANVTATAGVAIGMHSKTATEYGVALGAFSVAKANEFDVTAKQATFNGANVSFAGTNSGDLIGAVSVGTEQKQRQIQNVGAGRLSKTSTDAVNGSQLYAVMTNVGFNAAENGTSKARINNNSKLNFKNGTETVATVSTNGDVVYDLSTSAKANISNALSIATAANATANAANTTANAANITANAANTTANTANATANTANVTANTANATANTANATANTANATANTANATANTANATANTANETANTANSTANTANATANKIAEYIAADNTSKRDSAKAKGKDATAVGYGSNASGENGTALGNNSQASGKNSTAVGQDAKATADNSVALGQGSVANEANTVSVGSVGNERRITNVADPVRGTDAANKQYVDRSVGAVRSEMKKTDKKLRGGIAGATAAANIPQVTKAGGSMVGLGVGNYKGESAVAVGYSRASDNNKVIFKVSGAATTQGDYNVGAGVGYQW